MVLVDTSVLIDYLSGAENEPVKKFESIISDKIVFGINHFIYQEILQGANNEKEFGVLKSYLEELNFYNLKNKTQSFTDAAKIYFNCRRKGITIRSTIDLIIVQTAIENDLYLLHNDNDFDNIAKVISNLRIF